MFKIQPHKVQLLEKANCTLILILTTKTLFFNTLKQFNWIIS